MGLHLGSGRKGEGEHSGHREQHVQRPEAPKHGGTFGKLGSASCRQLKQ